MTELELQELTDKIIAKLKADSLTIDQLTQTNVLTGMDFLELNSGRKVSLDDLRKFIRGYGIYLEIISKLDNETIPTDNNVFSSLRVLFEISKALEELQATGKITGSHPDTITDGNLGRTVTTVL